MMKTILLVRHAKSDWSTPGKKDTERPLLVKGIERTQRVVDYLNRMKVCPDLIITSHAVRALETTKILAQGIGYSEKKIVVDKGIYASEEGTLLDVIYNVSDDFNTLMLVGHNPEFTGLANYFLDQPIELLPTSGVVSVSFKVMHWKEVGSARRTTNFVLFPKTLR